MIKAIVWAIAAFLSIGAAIAQPPLVGNETFLAVPPSGAYTVKAVCGVDNTALIQAALDGAVSSGAYRVVLSACPKSNPIIFTSFLMHDNLSMCGLRRGITWLKQADGANTPAIRGDNFGGTVGTTLNSNIELCDLSIDGNGSNQSSLATNRCVFFLGVANVNVHDVEIVNCRSDVVSINGNGSATASPTFVRDLYISGTTGVSGNLTAGLGFTLGNRQRNATVSRVFVENTSGPGVLVDASQGNWSDITSTGSGAGTTCTDAGTTTANSPGGAGAAQTAWTPCPPNIYFRNVTNIVASNMISGFGQYHGVVMVGARHVSINGLVSTQNSLKTHNVWDDLHLDYNVFVAGGYGENSDITINGAQLGANGQTAGNPADGSFPTSRYGLFLADGQTGAIDNILSIASGGTGNTFNDSLTISGGTSTVAAKLLVTAAPGGVITLLQHDYSVGSGLYSVLPSNPVTLTGGTGGGTRQANVSWSGAYMTAIHIGPTLTAAVRMPSFITGSGWTIQTNAGNFGP